jgi:hypothetical protein
MAHQFTSQFAMKKILIFIPLLLLPACATKRPAKAVVVPMPRSVPGTSLSPEQSESVRYGENLKAYPMGRYVDPNDPLVMHEAHTVYRVETTAQWNLHPNGPANVPSGPVVGIIDPAHKDCPVTAEVAAEVGRQKTATQALLSQNARMNDAVKQLSQSTAVTKQIVEDNLRLQNQITTTQKRLDALEEQFRKQPAEPLSTDPTSLPKGTNDW